MNREIKFRAWSPCEWEDNEPTKWFMSEQKDPSTDGLFRFSGGLYRESILMQYTGLKDKNGKEIYESDIVRFDGFTTEWYFSKPQIIEFLNYGWHPFTSYGVPSPEFIEVIGNIHENPNLL